MSDENSNENFREPFATDDFFNEENLKSISIRGVNADVYEQFVNKTKKLDMNVGIAITKLMQDVVYSFDEDFPEISAGTLRSVNKMPLSIVGHVDLTISKEDLEEPENQISFVGIQNLTFTPNVDKETFQKCINKIVGCHGVRIPNILPKLVLLSTLVDCKNIEFYDVD
ncbi:hypothetical protein NEF87_000591 [Candidatus Lokiarchaeum ossiferum]|uniref:Uncharacterized protein n=1 Tax=Candidatus Lokiarchaeum ossiferum TaxID=2951803 RepID=A0ABY6HLB8_9ARCH|nr:hypothetical protein NEF87_000591 [Candidatus Lokiarchaeum sp. B-35]